MPRTLRRWHGCLLLISLVAAGIGLESRSGSVACRADDEPPAGQEQVKIEVGERAPSLCAYDGAGDVMVAKDYQGKTLLVVFWSLDDPARDELIKQLQQVRQHHASDERFRLLAVCVDSDWEKWSQFSRDGKLFNVPKWWQLLDCPDCGEQIRKHARFDIETTPALFLVGPNNRFLAVDIWPDELSAVLEKHLPRDEARPAKP